MLPSDPNGRGRGIAWLIAALNSVEPIIFQLLAVDIFNRGQEWTKERRPQIVEFLETRLRNLSNALGDKEWFEGRFTIGDLMAVAVIRQLRHTDILAKFPNLAALVARAESRPAFKQALADQLAVFQEHQPEPEGEAA